MNRLLERMNNEYPSETWFDDIQNVVYDILKVHYLYCLAYEWYLLINGFIWIDGRAFCACLSSELWLHETSSGTRVDQRSKPER